jgi:hypothetical protein
MLLLRDAHVGAADAVNGWIVAEPVIATLVGGIAVVAAAAPITTAVASLLAVRVPATAIGPAHARPLDGGCGPGLRCLHSPGVA